MMRQQSEFGYNDYNDNQYLSLSLSFFLWSEQWKIPSISSFPLLYVWQWSMTQFIKSVLFHGTSKDKIPQFIHEFEKGIWMEWEQMFMLQQQKNQNYGDQKNRSRLLNIATIDFTSTNDSDKCNDYDDYLCPSSIDEVSVNYLNQHLGMHWRTRPILFRGMWSKAQLLSKPNNNNSNNNNSADDENNITSSTSQRRLSLHGLKHDEELSNVLVTYFTDASKHGALVPDSKPTPIRDIIDLLLQKKDDENNITITSKAKIGSQIPVQKIPTLIQDVAPPNFVKSLFGDRFEPKHLLKTAGIFPAFTTVPIFVAAISNKTNFSSMTCQVNNTTIELDHNNNDDNDGSINGAECGKENESNITNNNSDDPHSRTDLHCEPIGNIAVQLNGEKEWTLVSPELMHLLRPSISWNGRAFFYSMINPNTPVFVEKVPHYKAITKPGDGLWVPPWTWHQVDYTTSNQQNINDEDDDENDKISFAASLFHFRPIEFWKNNPLFALLVVPNMIKEVVGLNTE